ncbi:ABC transporter permease [Parapedobacter tibetensis]|uniref:ABC transporter permease n=1 Tax=Parapedobacter tibetensis TaxID=2972951 RepID=UPI00214D2776|nr:ABC transporter permease [Parapedobacter tibetensis]
MKIAKDFKLAASIAFTHMRAKLKQTIIATVGVAFGITVFIFMVSVMEGTNEFTEDVVFEQSPHLRLYNEIALAEHSILDRAAPSAWNVVHHQKPKDILPNLKDGIRAVEELGKDHRVLAISASVSTQLFYRLGSASVNGRVLGINFENEDALFALGSKIVEGGHEKLATQPNSLLMGVGLARKLNVATGDKLSVTTEKGDNFQVTIIGLFKTGLTDIDNQQSYASLKTVQRFLGVPASYITDIKVKLHDKELAPEIVEELENRYQYSGSDWKKDNSALLEGNVLRNMITYGVASTILLVAGFGIFNILTMMIYEKMKDIAILKATGFSDTDVRWVFLIQAIVIGFIGAVMGLIFGFLLAYATSRMPFESDVMITMDHLPVSFKPIYYISGFTFGILTTILAGYMPSRHAAKVDPITILRG